MLPGQQRRRPAARPPRAAVAYPRPPPITPLPPPNQGAALLRRSEREGARLPPARDDTPAATPRARVMREAGEPPSAGRAAIGRAGTPAAPSLAAGVGRWADGAPGGAARRGKAGEAEGRGRR